MPAIRRLHRDERKHMKFGELGRQSLPSHALSKNPDAGFSLDLATWLGVSDAITVRVAQPDVAKLSLLLLYKERPRHEAGVCETRH